MKKLFQTFLIMLAMTVCFLLGRVDGKTSVYRQFEQRQGWIPRIAVQSPAAPVTTAALVLAHDWPPYNGKFDAGATVAFVVQHKHKANEKTFGWTFRDVCIDADNKVISAAPGSNCKK